MNSEFKQNIINIYGDQGKKWLTDLPDIVNLISKKWHLTNIKPVANLSINYVASGWQDGQEIILKLSLDEDLIRKEYTALTALKDYGAAKVLAYETRTLLLKKLSPAISLKTYLPARKNEALKIACSITSRLHQAPLQENIKLPTIEERFALLDRDWPIPQDYLTLARKFRDEIFAKNHARKVLHGDLHHDNILQDRNGWKAIDPQGVIGFPINEVWAFVQDIDDDTLFIANYFNFDVMDVKKCYLMHAVLSSVWAVEDNMDPKFWLDLASKSKEKF